MRNRTKTIIFIIIFFLGMILVFFIDSPPVVNRSQIKPIALIEYPAKFNYRQTVNDCGPFNTAAIVRALKNVEVDSRLFAEKIKWRLPNKYTLPWGLGKQLKENGITIETPNLESLSGEDRILFLQEQLSQGKPIIILGEKDYFQHYITIFGFDLSKDEFYVYDSFHDKNPDAEDMTIDENEALPGNAKLSSEELLSFWHNGGIYGLYNWYAIVAST